MSRSDKLTVVSFVKNYAAVQALPDPSRLRGKTRDFLLESSCTIKSLYGEYCKAVKDPIQEGLASYTTTMPLQAYEPVTEAVYSAQCAYS